MSSCPLFKSNSSDIGRLILRLVLGGLMLVHGITKITGGIDFIKGLMTKHSLPEFLAYSIYFTEVIIPIFIIIGFKTRLSSLIFALSMFSAIFLTTGSGFLNISKYGGLVSELPLLYAFSAIALMFLGSGKYSVARD